MAQLIYRVTGRRGEDRVSQTFRSTDEGRKAASVLAAELENARTDYDVRTRIAGRVVTRTFKRRKDADAYASTVEADKLRGVAVDPRAGRVTLELWCRSWLVNRSDLRPTTRSLYAYLLDSHVLPALGGYELGRLTVSMVRSWHSSLLSERPAIAPKAYQVLRASLNTAVADGVLSANPCKVKGAGTDRPAERPVATMAEVEALASAVNARWRAMVLLAYWCGLRLGELRALRRSDLDLLHNWVEVREQIVDVGGRLMAGPPKTDAGRRRVAIPPHIVAELASHLELFVGAGAEAYVFTGHQGTGPLPSASWRRSWEQARRATALGHLRFHDLRHAGNTLAAATGASTRELMVRMGHASMRAAVIYQHATADRDQAIASALSELAVQAPVRLLTPRDRRAIEPAKREGSRGIDPG
jgi:integrase